MKKLVKVLSGAALLGVGIVALASCDSGNPGMIKEDMYTYYSVSEDDKETEKEKIKYTYSYDKNDNLLNKTKYCYTYGQVEYTSKVYEYEYDDNCNCTEEEITDYTYDYTKTVFRNYKTECYTTEYEYDEHNQLVLVTENYENLLNDQTQTSSYGTDYTYDVNGNVTSEIGFSTKNNEKVYSLVNLSYSYDDYNRLARMDYTNGGVILNGVVSSYYILYTYDTLEQNRLSG